VVVELILVNLPTLEELLVVVEHIQGNIHLQLRAVQQCLQFKLVEAVHLEALALVPPVLVVFLMLK
jgi:hypothetical protein